MVNWKGNSFAESKKVYAYYVFFLAAGRETAPESYINHDNDWEATPNKPQTDEPSSTLHNHEPQPANTNGSEALSVSQSKPANALSSLVGNYGDISSDDEENEEAVGPRKQKPAGDGDKSETIYVVVGNLAVFAAYSG